MFQDTFSIAEGIDGSVNSYTFDFRFSNSNCGSIQSNTVSVSSCESEVCSYMLETLASSTKSCFDRSSQVMLTVFASNILGDGLPSNISYIGNIKGVYLL